MAWTSTAARLLGLKLILLASFAAVGASVAPDPGLAAAASWGGMKLLHLILGTFGAGASLFFLPQFTLRWLGATVTSGIVCATAGTPFVMWAYVAYFDKGPFPGPAENVLAVVMGVVGVYVIPAIQQAAERIRGNPWGFFLWLRGGAAGRPPGVDASDEKGGGHV